MSEQFDASGYLLGELSDEQLAEAERRLSEDPALRAEVERLRPAVARLEDLPPEAWEDLAPPPLAFPRDPAAAAAAAPSRPAPRRWWQGLAIRPAFAALASIALLVVGVGVGLLIGSDGDDGAGEPGRAVALAPVEPRGQGASGSAELVGAVGGDGGEAVVAVSGVSPSEAGEFYELWLLNAPDDLISLGSFRVGASGRAEVTVPLPVDPGEFEFIDLSVERDDGDASHSGRSVLRAPT